MPNLAIVGYQGGAAARRRGPALGLSLPRPGWRTPAHRQDPGPARLTWDSSALVVPSSLAVHCPVRGHRVNDGPLGRRMRSASPTIDPAPLARIEAPARKACSAGTGAVGNVSPARQ
jgi:hypothetical protein